MAQRPKEHVRRAILAAAAHELAHGGFEAATVQAIAVRAGTSIGNVYKYFPDKQALYAAAVPDGLVRELRGLLEQRAAQAHLERAPRELLRFATEHRLQLLYLLRRAHGTAHSGFPDGLVAHMTSLALRRTRRKATPGLKRTLRRVYRGWVETLASILAEERSAAGFSEANALFLKYHLAGLQELLRA